jgi:hypothetical protein
MITGEVAGLNSINVIIGSSFLFPAQVDSVASPKAQRSTSNVQRSTPKFRIREIGNSKKLIRLQRMRSNGQAFKPGIEERDFRRATWGNSEFQSGRKKSDQTR